MALRAKSIQTKFFGGPKKKRIIDDKSYSGIIETDSVCGCCSVYKSNILKLSGLGDEEFFFGPEDIELSFRLKKFGKLIVNLDLKTFHNIVSSSKVSGWLSRSYYEKNSKSSKRKND